MMRLFAACRNTSVRRTTGTAPDAMMSNTFSPNARTSFLAYTGPTPRIMPDERYFSMPSAEVGGDVRKKRALNC